MNLSGLVESFSTGSYAVTRTTARTIKNGRAVAGTTSTITITASVSPATGMDLNKLPEGRRTSGAIAVFTTTQLRIGGVGDGFEADVVAANGSTWEVAHVETWVDPRSRATIYRCVAVNAS